MSAGKGWRRFLQRRPMPLRRFLLLMVAVPVVLRLGDLFGQWLEARWYGPGQVFRWTFFLAGMTVFVFLVARYGSE